LTQIQPNLKNPHCRVEPPAIMISLRNNFDQSRQKDQLIFDPNPQKSPNSQGKAVLPKLS